MLITRSNPQVPVNLAKSAPTLGAKATLTYEKPSAPPADVFKKSVTSAAYAAGGALGGLALGAVSGEVMSRLTQNEIFSTFGGGVGAIGGAATSLALSLSNEPVSMARTFGSWAGASVGATGGMYAMGGIGTALASHGAAALFGTEGALLGAVGLGLAGAGVAFAGADGKVATIAKSAGKAGAGALVGLAAGGFVQALLSNVTIFAPIANSAPFVGAATLGLVGLQTELNKGWVLGGDYKPDHPTFDTVFRTGFGAAIGCGLGSAMGVVLYGAGASAAYATAGPLLGAAVGAAVKYGEAKHNKLANDLAVTGVLAGSGALVGDLVGHGLTALTGQPVFQMMGVAAGAVMGGTLTLDAQKRVNKYVAPVAAGLTAGTLTGTLLGVGLTAITGHSAYQVAGSAIGLAAGLLAGLAGGAHRGEATPAANQGSRPE